MPFPACHTGHVIAMEKLILIGGGLTTRQVKSGSSPRSLNVVQVFDLQTRTWASKSFHNDKDFKTSRMSLWIDYARNNIYGLRAGETAMSTSFDSDLALPIMPVKQIQGQYKPHRSEYLKGERDLMANAISSCINSEMKRLHQTMTTHTMFDEGYEDVRTTWNKRLQHLQFPDIVTMPESSEQVSLIVQCAKRTGHHLCGRNGKHSFEGDTCTYGIVVDVAKLSSVKLLGPNHIRFGGGLHLGRVAVELERHGLM